MVASTIYRAMGSAGKPEKSPVARKLSGCAKS
jgi:hypothetical protein